MYNKARAQFSGITIKYKDNNTLCSEAIFFIGNSFEAEDKWDSALQEYKKIMDKYPVTPKGLEIPFYITKYYETKNELDKMIGAYKEAVAYYDSLSLKYADTQFGFLAMNLKAQSYMALKDWESAIGTYYDVLRKYQGKLPLDDVLMKIALIYDRQLEDKVKTKDILERLIKEYPKSRFRDLAAGVLEELNENN
jgi:TolA-binding protein